MFTGLIEIVGRIASTRRTGDGMHLSVEAPEIASRLEVGQSVAVSGPCLTVTRHDPRRFEATAVGETLRRTALAEIRVGSRVNLERSLALGDRLDGHLVQGHVDGVGEIRRMDKTPPGITMSVAIPTALMRYVARKGSIAVDGVSLTVVDLTDGGFSTALVPHTLDKTTLGEARVGGRVNIEVDLMARYIEQFLSGERWSGGEDHDV